MKIKLVEIETHTRYIRFRVDADGQPVGMLEKYPTTHNGTYPWKAFLGSGVNRSYLESFYGKTAKNDAVVQIVAHYTAGLKAAKARFDAAARFDFAGFLTAYESGELGDCEVIDGFQALIDSGVLYQLQGSYGRTAANLIEQGLCHR
jgi:hypothetical protein